VKQHPDRWSNNSSMRFQTPLIPFETKNEKSMKNTLETRIGLFVALVVLAAAIVLERVGSFEMFEHGRHVNALFATCRTLKWATA